MQIVPVGVENESRFENTLGHNDEIHCGAHKTHPLNHGRRLIDRGVDFVIGRFGDIDLRNSGNEENGANQKYDEQPDSPLHVTPPRHNDSGGEQACQSLSRDYYP